MKKYLCAFLMVMVLAGCAFAAEKSVQAGILTYLGTTEEEFQEGLDSLRKALNPLLPADGTPLEEFDLFQGFVGSLVKQRRIVHFYDSLMAMQMALQAGMIEEMALPESVALYLVDRNPNYDILFSLNLMPSSISFGFRQGDTALRDEFNAAIAGMRKDGTLEALEAKHITGLGKREPSPVRFQNFKGAPTVTVAVTGDMPPIDLIAADGRPAGYSTAVLAEISRRLKKNIKLVSVEAGARSAALASGRADAVFWYRSTEGIATPLKNNPLVIHDKSANIILSSPYYEWDADLIVGFGSR